MKCIWLRNANRYNLHTCCAWLLTQASMCHGSSSGQFVVYWHAMSTIRSEIASSSSSCPSTFASRAARSCGERSVFPLGPGVPVGMRWALCIPWLLRSLRAGPAPRRLFMDTSNPALGQPVAMSSTVVRRDGYRGLSSFSSPVLLGPLPYEKMEVRQPRAKTVFNETKDHSKNKSHYAALLRVLRSGVQPFARRFCSVLDCT